MDADTVRNLASVASVIVAIVAARVAYSARLIAGNTFRFNSRPIVRVVGTVVGGGTNPKALQLDCVKLKNIGRGHAFAVIAFDPSNAAIMGELDALEPLGSGPSEPLRLGNVTVHLRRQMKMGNEYLLLYQDILGTWHCTRFKPRHGITQISNDKIECAFPGAQKDSEVPREIQPLGTISHS